MISVTLMVKDGEKHLAECLESLKRFDEVLLLDTGSTDRTLEIAQKFDNLKIVERDLDGEWSEEATIKRLTRKYTTFIRKLEEGG